MMVGVLSPSVVFSTGSSQITTDWQKVSFRSWECSHHELLLFWPCQGLHPVFPSSSHWLWHSKLQAAPHSCSKRHTFLCHICQTMKILPLGGSYGGDRRYFLQVASSRREKTKTNKLSLPCGFLLMAVNMPDQSRHRRKTDSEVTEDTTSVSAFSKHVMRVRRVTTEKLEKSQEK